MLTVVPDRMDLHELDLQDNEVVFAQTIETVEVKTCTVCGETKSVTEFYINRSRKNRPRSRCKTCDLNLNHRWNEERRSGKKDEISYKANNLRKHMIARAKKRNQPFDQRISHVFLKDVVKFVTHCECCKVKFRENKYRGINGASKNSLTIDCVKPDLGYRIDNIAALCHSCNSIKSRYGSSNVQYVYDWCDQRFAEIEVAA